MLSIRRCRPKSIRIGSLRVITAFVSTYFYFDHQMGRESVTSCDRNLTPSRSDSDATNMRMDLPMFVASVGRMQNKNMVPKVI